MAVVKSEERRAFRVGISDEEKDGATKDLLVELAEVEKLQEDAKDSAKGYRERIKVRAEKVQELRMTLERGKEEVLDSIKHTDFGKGKVWWTDPATGKVLEKRDLTDEDAQLSTPAPSDPEAED